MGLSSNDLQILIDLQRSGAALEQVLTVGHQWLVCSKRELKRLLLENRFDEPAVAALLAGDLQYADPVLHFIGVKQIEIMDVSDYEGATVIQDLNQPLDEKNRHQSYDLVLDGGTLEHVFNVPEAFRTLMSLTRVGGHLMLINPCNNQCGHGFYQFSPELMFRVFDSANGFEIVNVFCSETYIRDGYRSGKVRKVRDPREVHGRIDLDYGLPMTMSTVAKCSRRCALFETPPLQSDYSAAWEQFKEGDVVAPGGGSGKVNRFKSYLHRTPEYFAGRLMQAFRTLQSPLENRRFYKNE